MKIDELLEEQELQEELDDDELLEELVNVKVVFA